MGIMGMMSKLSAMQQHCCCMADSFFAMRAVAARWGYKQRKRSASWTDADLSC